MLAGISTLLSLTIFLAVLLYKWKYTLYQTVITFIVLASLILFSLSLLVRDERKAYILAYIPLAFFSLTPIIYAARAKEFNPVSLVFIFIAYQIVLTLQSRFKKIKFLEELYIIFLSILGFWIILIKFSNLGYISLLLAVNTALLIGFLSYYLMEEEE